MKRNILFAGLLIVPVFLLILGCGGEPANELAAAKQALENARAAEADKYAPDLFTRAETAIAEAENLIAQKKYGEAKKLLVDAKNAAESAATQAVTNKDEAKTQVEDFLAEIGKVRAQLKDAQDKAKEWGIPKKQRELTEETAKWDQNLEKARAEYDAGNYHSAKELAAGVYQEVTAKDSELREAIMAKQK